MHKIVRFESRNEVGAASKYVLEQYSHIFIIFFTLGGPIQLRKLGFFPPSGDVKKKKKVTFYRLP